MFKIPNSLIWVSLLATAALGLSLYSIPFGQAASRAGQNGIAIPTFKDVTQEVGLSDTTETFGAVAANLTDDDYPDLLVSRHRILSLHRNLGGGKFLARAFLSEDYRDTHGVACADFNNDGRVDILTARGADRGLAFGPKEVFINRDFEFEKLSNLSSVVVDSQGRGRSIIPYDINRDGLMDFFIGNYYQKGKPHRIAMAQAGKENSFVELEGAYNLKHASTTSFLPLNLFNDDREYIIYQGNGLEAGKALLRVSDTSWVDVTRRIGLEYEGLTRKVLPLDFDNDGDLDLLYLKCFKETLGTELLNNRLSYKYTNDRYKNTDVGFVMTGAPKRFKVYTGFTGWEKPDYLYLGKNRRVSKTWPIEIDETTDLAGDPQVNPLVDEGCFLWQDDKGALHFQCICTKGVFSEIAGYLVFQEKPERLHVTDVGLKQRRLEPRNKLFRNDGQGFSALTNCGLEGAGLAFDAVAEDFNNDGWLDVYIVNGGDHFSNPPNSLFLNQRNGTFKDVASEAGAIGPNLGNGNGCVPLDYDLDGDLDLFLYNGAGSWPNWLGPFVFLENQLPPSNYITVSLRGTISNTQGWGTRLIFYNNGQATYRQKHPADGCLSTSDLPIHFGLGSSKSLDSLTIIWPSGQVARLENIPTGSNLKIQEKKQGDQ